MPPGNLAMPPSEHSGFELGLSICLIGALSTAAAVTDALSAAERSYPTSQVRGSGRECQAATAQEWQRRATQVRGQGQRQRGATPRPRSGVAARRRYPTPPRLRPEVTAGRSNRMPEVRGSSREELPHV